MKFVDVLLKYKEDREIFKEVDDCVVTSIAVAFNLDYEEALLYSRDFLGRESREGASILRRFDGKDYLSKYSEATTYCKIAYEILRGVREFTDMTGTSKCNFVGIGVRNFIDINPLGTYLVVFRGHAAVIIDSVLYGEEIDQEDYLIASYKINHKRILQCTIQH